MRVLIVEDNRKLSSWLAKLLRADRYVVDCVDDGSDGAYALETKPYDVAIVDLGLPSLSGVQLIARVRNHGIVVPILILTANNSIEQRVAGLDVGADDYLAKPFDTAELEARLRALVRRTASSKRSEIEVGPLTFNQNTRLFSVGGSELHLSPKEHSLLETLVRNAGKTVSKSQLLESLYGFDEDADLGAIELNVHRLRKRLEGTSVSIVTLRGLGYLLRASDG